MEDDIKARARGASTVAGHELRVMPFRLDQADSSLMECGEPLLELLRGHRPHRPTEWRDFDLELTLTAIPGGMDREFTKRNAPQHGEFLFDWCRAQPIPKLDERGLILLRTNLIGPDRLIQPFPFALQVGRCDDLPFNLFLR